MKFIYATDCYGFQYAETCRCAFKKKCLLQKQSVDEFLSLKHNKDIRIVQDGGDIAVGIARIVPVTSSFYLFPGNLILLPESQHFGKWPEIKEKMNFKGKIYMDNFICQYRSRFGLIEVSQVFPIAGEKNWIMQYKVLEP